MDVKRCRVEVNHWRLLGETVLFQVSRVVSVYYLREFSEAISGQEETQKQEMRRLGKGHKPAMKGINRDVRSCSRLRASREPFAAR